MAKRPYDSRRWREQIRPGILKRDNYTCQIQFTHVCRTRATVVDHIIPWGDGGPWYDEWNLRAACQPCNVERQRLPDPVKHTNSRSW